MSIKIYNLSETDAVITTKALENPPEPNEALKAVFASTPSEVTLTVKPSEVDTTMKLVDLPLVAEYTKGDQSMFYVREIVPDYTKQELIWISKGLKKAYEYYPCGLLPVESKILNAESDKYPTKLYDAKLAQFVHHFSFLTRQLNEILGPDLDKEVMKATMEHVFRFGELNKVALNRESYATVNDVDFAFGDWKKNF